MSLLRQKLTRYSFVAFFSLLLTAISLVAMNSLISHDDEVVKSSDELKFIDFSRVRTMIEPERIKRIDEIKPPEEKIEPQIFEVSADMPSRSSFDMPKLDLPNISTANAFAYSGVGEMSFVARDLVPIAGLPPEYPRRARILGIEGMVELEFTITESGFVEDIKVIRSVNGEHFEQTAINTVKRWKFKPKIVDAKPVRQRAVQSFEFGLDR